MIVDESPFKQWPASPAALNWSALMGLSHLGILFVIAAGLGQGGGQNDYYAGLTAAGRELSTKLDLFQQSLVTIGPSPSVGRGIYQQSNGIMYDLIYFQQQVKRQVSRDDLYIAYDKMDGKLETLLGDLKAFEKWDPALRMMAKQVISANHDVQFALAGGGDNAPRKGQAAYRQTLVILDRVGNLENLVRFVFDEQASLPAWNAEFKALRQSIADLQSAQKNKASKDEAKAKFQQTDQAWEKLVTRFKALNEDQQLLLRLGFGQVDQIFARLAPLFGIDNRRAPLKADFS